MIVAIFAVRLITLTEKMQSESHIDFAVSVEFGLIVFVCVVMHSFYHALAARQPLNVKKGEKNAA